RLHQEKHSLRQRLERCPPSGKAAVVSELEGDLQAASSELQSAAGGSTERGPGAERPPSPSSRSRTSGCWSSSPGGTRSADFQGSSSQSYGSRLAAMSLKLVTLKLVTLKFKTLKLMTLKFMTLKLMTLKFMTLKFVTLKFKTLKLVTLKFMTLKFMTLKLMTLKLMTLKFVTLKLVTLKLVTLKFGAETSRAPSNTTHHVVVCAAEVEQQLSTQVVGLRDEFREKSFSTQQHLARLESLQAEIRLLTERKSELERRLRDAALENEQLHAAVHEMQQRDFALQHAGRARDAQLRECELELQEACSGRRQLQLRLDSLQQELSLVSGEPHGASPESLLAELTRSEHSQRLQQRSREVEVEVWDVYCQLHSLCTQLRGLPSLDDRGSNELTGLPSLDDRAEGADLMGFPSLDDRGVGAEPCGLPRLGDRSLNELRGPLRLDDRTSSESAGLPSLEEGERAEPEGLPRLDDVGGVAPGGLRVMVKELKQLVMAVVLTSSNEVRRRHQGGSEEVDVEEALRRALQERDDAINKRSAVEMELAVCKIDVMALNSQLLDAIQQKVDLSQELEAWQFASSSVMTFVILWLLM
ncbi:unnamed protein product, partial [Lampetra planeri]